MIYYNVLYPRYARQKDFYNKAQMLINDSDNIKTIKLYSDNIKVGFTEVARIVIDKKHIAKNRYFITTNKKLLDAVTLKHIYDFIFQYYQHKTTKEKLFTRGKFVKNKVFKYALNLD